MSKSEWATTEKKPYPKLQPGGEFRRVRSENSMADTPSNRRRFRQPKKFRWHDGQDRQLTAGGILPYDEHGIWVIGEIQKSGDIEWTDTGGKYRFEDCDIYATIAREFNEEVYFSSELSRKDIVSISESHRPVYVNGHCNFPVYECYVVHTNILERYETDLSPQRFDQRRKITIQQNPDVPENYYNSVALRHISFDIISNAMHTPNPSIELSYRLKRILRYGPLAAKISPPKDLENELEELCHQMALTVVDD